MPATAGRVRMPANNRVHSSAALQTHGIWQSAIGYDPYAPNKDDSKSSSQPKASINSASEPEGDNAYANFQGLLALARITGSNTDEARGSCKRCGRVGHLSFQCRNFLSVKDDIKEKEKDSDAIQAAVLSGLEKIKGGRRIAGKDESDDEEEESDEEDSEVDSEIERIIARKHGKRSSGGRSLKKKDDGDDDESESDDEGRKKRGRSKKRRSKKRESSDSEDEDEAKRKKRRKEKRRKRDDSSDEEEEEENRRRRKRKSRKEKRRRRSHRYSDDSDSQTSEDSGRRHLRKSRKAASPSDSDASGSDDSRVGRGTKRSEMRSKKRHHD